MVTESWIFAVGGVLTGTGLAYVIYRFRERA